MEQFIEVIYSKYGRKLLDRYEYSVGDVPNEREQLKREKREKKGEIEVIQNEDQFIKPYARPITRKISY